MGLDKELKAALRRRLVRELERDSQAQSIVNNVYGSAAQQEAPKPSGVEAAMLSGDDPFDYYVDINRRDSEDINPATGKPFGWEKKVHRYRQKKE